MAQTARARHARHGRVILAHPVLLGAEVCTWAAIVWCALWRIGAADAAPDEFIYRNCAASYVAGSFKCNWEHPPLAKELLSLGLLAGHDSVTSARVVAAVAAVATALFCYLFVRDCTDRIGGLIAAAAFGLLPQAGVEGNTVLEWARIDRYGLLDPFAACFVAAAIWLGWRWCRTGARMAACLAGAACAAAVAAKTPGGAVAVAVVAAAVLTPTSRRHIARGIAWFAAGAAAVVVCTWAPLGTSAWSQISYMWRFQRLHSQNGSLVIIAHHLYLHAPWWADLSFATVGLTRPVALVLVLCAAVALVRAPRPAAFALSAAAATVLAVGLGAHLALPNYWVVWEPGLIGAASIGLRLLPASVHAPLGRAVAVLGSVAAAAVLALGVAWTIRTLAGPAPDAYQQAARLLRCDGPCTIDFAGFDNIPINYAPARVTIRIGPPTGRSRVRGDPAYVAVDPAVLPIHAVWRHDVATFARRATALGYRRLPDAGRIAVWARAPLRRATTTSPPAG